MTINESFQTGKRRSCVMTGMPADTSISLTDDPHNWTRKIPVCMVYAEEFKLGNTKKWKDLELKARDIFYKAELGPSGEWLKSLSMLENVWSIIRPEIEFLMAKKQVANSEEIDKAACDLQAALLNNIEDLELE